VIRFVGIVAASAMEIVDGISKAVSWPLEDSEIIFGNTYLCQQIFLHD
jgi:hypothetical protein